MQLLIPKENLKNYKCRDLIPIKCDYCLSEYMRSKNIILHFLCKPKKKRFCSKQCADLSRQKRLTISCDQCNTLFTQKQSEYKRHKNHFCSNSCKAIYGNTHKTKGSNRSKLENWLESKLTELYPNLDIHYNRSDTINGELDIYIPSLKLAFELNGIFHYEPIFSKEKLEKTQTNDKRKFQACLERGIELCIIDISSQKYFKENTSKVYLEIVQSLIKI